MKTSVQINESTLRKLRVLCLLGLAILVLTNPVLAQGQTTAKLTTIKNTFSSIVNVLFAIGMLYGLIKTVLAFIGQKEGGMMNLLWLVVAAIVWVAFNLFMNDVGISSATGIGGR